MMPDAVAVPDHYRKGAPQDPHQARRHRAVLALLDGLSGRLLDYGCGYGDLSFAMAARGFDVIGVDVNAERVAFAAAEYAPLSFAQCRTDGLDFADASFDVVASIVVLPFVPDPEAHLAEVRRVLKPGGHLVLAGRNEPPLTRLSRRFGARRSSPSLRHAPLRCAPSRLLARTVEQAGFVILRRTAFYDPPFDNRRTFYDLVNSAVELVAEAVGAHDLAPYPLLLASRA